MNFADRLEKCYSGAVYDVLRSMGYLNQVLPSTLRPLDPSKKLAGPIFTVSGHKDVNLDPQEAYLKYGKF